MSDPLSGPPHRYFEMARRSLAVLSLVVCSYFTPAAAVAQDTGLKKPSFDSRGVPIHYIVTGRVNGEPVVLIHGFADNIEQGWTHVIAALRKDFKIVALDCRGHGGSGKPHDPKAYGIEMVNDVARLLDHLKIDKAHVVGYSMGSVIALSFAAHYPQRVRTVTLGGGGVVRGRDALILAAADSLEKGNGLGPVVIALNPKNQPKPTAEAIKRVDDVVLARNDAKALAAVCRGIVGGELSDKQVKSVRVPTLAIIGADDPIRVDADRLKKLLPKTRVVVIDKAGHSALYRPEFVSALRQFLDDNRRPPAR